MNVIEKARAAAAALTDFADALARGEHLEAEPPRAAPNLLPAPQRPAYAAPGPQRPGERHDVPVAPMGMNKGIPLSELKDSDLTWLASALQRSVDDPSKTKYRAANARDLENVRQEQNRRLPAIATRAHP